MSKHAREGSAIRRWIFIVAALGALGAGLWVARPVDPAAGLRYVTARAETGDLNVKVSATGNLQPTTQVDVGSELSGLIDEVLVNDNDRVTKGQVLARLDTSRLEDQVFRSEAALKSAEAAVKLNEAAVREARSTLSRLQEAWKLSGGRVPSKSELTAAEAAADKAAASETSARAAVLQAEAALRSDKTNLDKAAIRSPIDGVVLLRSVEPGQTVAASLQAPVLFVLAQSLTQMELQVDIDEADVGQVREGQEASFTVDAYPERSYPARIVRVRYGAQAEGGVVTYQGVLQVDNADLSLRPGMTATANILTEARKGVLLVPNAALRYAPEAAAAPRKKGPSVVSALIPRGPRDDKPKTVTLSVKGGDQAVWVLRGGAPVRVPVKAGVSDGKTVEILEGELKAGDEVILDAEKASS